MAWKFRKNLNDFMTAVSTDTEGEVWIYGDIVDDAWDDEVSPVVIRNTLDEMGSVGTLNLRVNSYGGSVYAGNAIINILDSYRRKTGCKIHAYIEGIAASMGSGIPMVADKIYMAENAMYMLHKPFTIVMGNSEDLEKEIEVLQKAEETLIKNYMRHFTGTEDELRNMLLKETWLTADEAIQYGLCDEIIPAVAIAASAKGIMINGREFQKEKIVAKFHYNTPLAKAVDKPEKEENKLFEYDIVLGKYGITEDMFKGYGINSSSALAVAVNVAASLQQAKQEEFISASAATEFLGNEFSAEKILNFAKKGLEIDDKVVDKSKAYDKLFNLAIDEAIKNGVRAKGDKFNETKWKKILSSLDYDEIIDQSKEWDEEAKFELKAGRRVSEPWKQEDNKRHENVNPEDYNFCK